MSDQAYDRARGGNGGTHPGGKNAGQGIHLGAALEVKTEGTKLPKPRRKATHWWRRETTVVVVAAHGAVSLSAGTTRVHNGGEERAWLECASIGRSTRCCGYGWHGGLRSTVAAVRWIRVRVAVVRRTGMGRGCIPKEEIKEERASASKGESEHEWLLKPEGKGVGPMSQHGN
jgi:hypothetical protein